LAGVLGAYYVLKRSGNRMALVVVLLFLTSPVFFNLSTGTILSDLPYFSISMFALLLGVSVEKKQGFWEKVIYAVFLAVFLVAAVLTRLTGIMLPLGCGMWIVYSFLVEKKYAVRRCAVFGVPVILGFLCFAFWMMWSASRSVIEYPGQYMDSYVAQMKLLDPHRPELGPASLPDFILRIINNLPSVIADLWNLVAQLPVNASFLSVLIVVPLILLGVGMAYRVIERKADFPFWYFCSYTGMILAWPFHEGMRFIVPIVPFICLYVAEGALRVFAFGARNFNKCLRLCAGVAVVAAIVSWYLVISGHCRGLQEFANCLFWIGSSFLMLIYLLFNPLSSGVVKVVRGILAHFGRAGKKIAGSGVGWLVFVPVLLVNTYTQAGIALAAGSNDPRGALNYALVEAGLWIKTHVAASETVCAVQKEIIAQVSGRRTVAFPISSSPEFLCATILKSGADYLVIYDEGEYPYFYPDDKERLLILQKYKPDALTCIYEHPPCRIFKINR
jgi:hypothetical protein